MVERASSPSWLYQTLYERMLRMSRTEVTIYRVSQPRLIQRGGAELRSPRRGFCVVGQQPLTTWKWGRPGGKWQAGCQCMVPRPRDPLLGLGGLRAELTVRHCLPREDRRTARGRHPSAGPFGPVELGLRFSATLRLPLLTARASPFRGLWTMAFGWKGTEGCGCLAPRPRHTWRG